VSDPRPLTNHVLVPRFRDEQIKELTTCFLGTVAKVRPLHAWVHGPPGTGKTLCIRHVLRIAGDQKAAVPVYVNCRERFTFFAVLEAILGTIKPLRSPYRSREHQLSILREEFATRRAVIAIDDADVLPNKDLADLIYQLTSPPQVSLLCVAASRKALLSLPQEVLSRFSPRQVIFPRFSPEEIGSMVHDIVERALIAESCTSDVAALIAEQAYGDARRAMALLRHAVQRAEEEGAQQIGARHLRPPNLMHFSPQAEDVLASLSSHHRVLHDIVASRTRISAVDIEAAYSVHCSTQGIPSVASRTVAKYLAELCSQRVLDREHGSGSAGWVYSLYDHRMQDHMHPTRPESEVGSDQDSQPTHDRTP
jgi:Cdc6-like AAA superfamily ATPase